MTSRPEEPRESERVAAKTFVGTRKSNERNSTGVTKRVRFMLYIVSDATPLYDSELVELSPLVQSYFVNRTVTVYDFIIADGFEKFILTPWMTTIPSKKLTHDW